MASNELAASPPIAEETPTITAEIEEMEDRLGPLLERPEEPCAFVIFGASGDLTGRKLIPALYNLFCQELLPRGFAVIGYALTPMEDASFRQQMRQKVKDSPEVLAFRPKLWDEFAPALHYLVGDFENPTGYQQLAERLRRKSRFLSGDRPHFLRPHRRQPGKTRPHQPQQQRRRLGAPRRREALR